MRRHGQDGPTRGSLSHASAVVLAAGLAGCASPTVITVDVYTEVACEKDAEVSLTLADTLAALADSAPSSSSRGCVGGKDDGHVGTVVIAPADDKEKRIAFAVATRDDGGAADECLQSPLPAACIVARRQLRFEPNLDLPMRIDLRDACRGVDCPSDQTCVKGTCVSAVVPADCAGACDDSQLVPKGAGGPSLLAAKGGPGVRLVATKKGFGAAWPTKEPDGKFAVRLQALSSAGRPLGELSRPIAAGADPITELLLGHDGTNFGLAVRAAATSFMIATADGSVIAGPAAVDGATGLPVHGLPWNGAHFAVLMNGPGAEDMTFNFYDNQAMAAGYNATMSPGVVGSAAWDGTEYFAATFTESGGRCSFFYTPDAAAFPGFAQLADDCAGMHLAPRAGGGWHLAYQTESSPSRVYYAAIDSSGAMKTGPTQVSLGDGQSYGAAQVVATPKGAAVFFAPSGGATGSLYRADVDEAAALSTPAVAVPSVVVAGQSYEVAPLGTAVGVAWYGRTDEPGAAATGVYATTLGL